MTTHILGISAYFHDSAAALLRDGVIVAAVQEERFTRLKADAGFPSQSIEYCLREAGIAMVGLDYAVFYEKPMVKFERLLETYAAVTPQGIETFDRSMPLWANHRLRLPEVLREQLGEDFSGQILFTAHHESHAASAFFPSPFADAAILTLDAVGEWSTSALGHGQGNHLELTHEMRFPHSLGMLYSAFTYYTGFKVNSGEYKLMGLAPYGKPKYAQLIRDKIVDIRDDGSLWLDMSCFDYCHGDTMTSDKFHEIFGGPPRDSESPISQKEMDLASSIQAVCEEVVLKAAHHVQKVTGSKNVVMAGGVALNCVANGKLQREGPFEKVWVQPAAGDAGGALGAAFLAWHHMLDQPRTPVPGDAQQGSYLGPHFSNDEIGVFLDSVGAGYAFVEDEDTLLEQVACLLDEGKVVGWFCGRMEYGPRSLGARSILGDPRSTSMQQMMNVKIKFRESFRPFAPCVLREFASEIFEMQPEDDAPYMQFVAPLRDAYRTELDEEARKQLEDPDLRVRVAVARSKFPAITHVDYSARVQTVDAERHGRFYRLMQRFYEVTDCPIVVNTSFNIRGEPIVCSPEDAFRCFMGTNMDALVLENHLLAKEEQPTDLVRDAEIYRTQFALD